VFIKHSECVCGASDAAVACLGVNSFSLETSENVVDRVEVKLTHFNNSKLSGFVSIIDDKYFIFKALGLDLGNCHGTSFRRKKLVVICSSLISNKSVNIEATIKIFS
jgi:hypothetical protein